MGLTVELTQSNQKDTSYTESLTHVTHTARIRDSNVYGAFFVRNCKDRRLSKLESKYSLPSKRRT
jgi:hypothetical protein